MRNILSIVLVIFILSCATNKTIQNRACFNYKIPEGMYDNKADARRYSYDNFIIEKDKAFEDSMVLIAIRHRDTDKNTKLKAFVESDQYWLNNQVKIYYEDEWIPKGFEDKKINYNSYQFYYKQQGQLIYQRSVYIKCNDTVYIISMSSKNKSMLIHENNDNFWQSITAN
jgi:hypothetical protein